jgi:hypothetical protein
MKSKDIMIMKSTLSIIIIVTNNNIVALPLIRCGQTTKQVLHKPKGPEFIIFGPARLVSIAHDKSTGVTMSDAPARAHSAKPAEVPPSNPGTSSAKPTGVAEGGTVATPLGYPRTGVDSSPKRQDGGSNPAEVNIVATVPRSSFYAPFLPGGGSGVHTGVAEERMRSAAVPGLREPVSQGIEALEGAAAELVELSLLDVEEELDAGTGDRTRDPLPAYLAASQSGEVWDATLCNVWCS